MSRSTADSTIGAARRSSTRTCFSRSRGSSADGDSHIYAVGPAIHRDAPGEHDNWLAPLVFEGKRKEGGYFHAPILLTSSHWNKDGAFTVIGPYFRNRTGGDVDLGVAPFYFHGDNTSEESSGKQYTLIPPLFYYHRDREADDNHITVIGPVLSEQSTKRNTFDVLPLYFSYVGKPESGGIREHATTFFPFFHTQESDDKQTFVLPGYYHKTAFKNGAVLSDTVLTPFYSHSSGREGATDLTAAGPIFPVYWKYKDRDLDYASFGVLPFYWGGRGPAGSGLFTPLFAKFETYGVSRTYWAFPNITVHKDTTGWETDLHPLIYLGRNLESSHTVVAPVFWDFDNKKSRTTIGVPAFFRYADYTDNSIVQVAGNTLYLEKRVQGGKDWQFHFLPIFSYGENPNGYFWNVLFGLAGYSREASVNTVRAFWIPFQTSGAAAGARGHALSLTTPRADAVAAQTQKRPSVRNCKSRGDRDGQNALSQAHRRGRARRRGARRDGIWVVAEASRCRVRETMAQTRSRTMQTGRIKIRGLSSIVRWFDRLPQSRKDDSDLWLFFSSGIGIEDKGSYFRFHVRSLRAGAPEGQARDRLSARQEESGHVLRRQILR